MNEKELCAIAITHPYREGQRFDEILLNAPEGFCESDMDSVTVPGRTILEKELAAGGLRIYISPEDEGAKELYTDPATASKPVPGAPFNPAMVMPLQFYRKSDAVVQINGREIRTSKVREILVDEFVSEKKYRLYSNLFSPGQLDEKKRYPLVVFIPDASVNQDDPRFALLHGAGAVSFAAEEIQEEMPCFVLAIQVPKRIPFVSDDFSCADEFDDLKRIIDDVVSGYPIDRKKIYLLGGSQGCMSSMELNCRYPDFFAASILAAGQWDPERVGTYCAHKKLWFFVSDGDEKGYPGMLEIMEELEKNGARIARFTLDAKLPPEEKERQIKEAEAADANIRFTVFKNHSIIPEGTEDNGGANHMNTWPEVYSYLELKRWLLAQTL